MSDSSPPSCSPAARVTRSLLGYGVLAGLFYVIASVIEGLVHRDEGFRFTRDDWSLLAAGSHGWVHQVVFILTGAMVMAAAVGIARAMSSRWAGRLIATYGIGLVAAGIFVADGNGNYPIGSSDSSDISGHGLGHLLAAMSGFMAVIAATYVVAAEQSRSGRSGAALASRATGTIFLFGFIGVATGSTSTAIVLSFTFAVVLLWAWLAALSVKLFKDVLIQDRVERSQEVNHRTSSPPDTPEPVQPPQPHQPARDPSCNTWHCYPDRPPTRCPHPR